MEEYLFNLNVNSFECVDEECQWLEILQYTVRSPRKLRLWQLFEF